MCFRKCDGVIFLTLNEEGIPVFSLKLSIGLEDILSRKRLSITVDPASRDIFQRLENNNYISYNETKKEVSGI